MTSKTFLENSLDELFEWCSLVLDTARSFYQERFPKTPSIQTQWRAQQDLLDQMKATNDLRGLRIMAVDLFEAVAGAHEDLVQRINSAAIARFGEGTAIIPGPDDFR